MRRSACTEACDTAVVFSNGFNRSQIFDKIDVNGENADPLWKHLKSQQGDNLGPP